MANQQGKERVKLKLKVSLKATQKAKGMVKLKLKATQKERMAQKARLRGWVTGQAASIPRSIDSQRYQSRVR